ncbi:MAG: hypothetical protein H0W20_12240 [Chthoniobacterales bacterium]|nr:hypothetical protein [Chthoniobacterales bacterium]
MDTNTLSPKFHIYSFEKRLFWKPKETDYTKKIEEAGQYSAEELAKILCSRNEDYDRPDLSVLVVPDSSRRTKEEELDLAANLQVDHRIRVNDQHKKFGLESLRDYLNPDVPYSKVVHAADLAAADLTVSS